MGKKRKYDAVVAEAINSFWIENKYPPTLRDIMKITGISSTCTCRYAIRKIDGIRFAENSRIIPKWVDDLFKERDAKRK